MDPDALRRDDPLAQRLPSSLWNVSINQRTARGTTAVSSASESCRGVGRVEGAYPATRRLSEAWVQGAACEQPAMNADMTSAQLVKHGRGNLGSEQDASETMGIGRAATVRASSSAHRCVAKSSAPVQSICEWGKSRLR